VTWYTPSIGEFSRPAETNLDKDDLSRGMLLRSTNWLGDVLMTLPAVYRLRSMLPAGAPFYVSCPAKLASLWQAVDWVDNVIPFDEKRLSGAERKALHELEVGVTVVLPNSFGSAWDLWKAGVANRIGRGGRGRGALLHHTLPAWNRVAGEDSHHQVREYLEIAAACGSTDWGCDYPALAPSPELVNEWRRELGKSNTLVIAPGAAYGPAKQWPAESFNKVAKWWAANEGQVIAVGTPQETEVAESAIRGVSYSRSVAGSTDLADLIAILSLARVVVANDSGAMHLAAALKRDGVAIFGSTDAVATGPIGGRWIVEQHALPCSPCLERTCAREDAPYECLTQVTSLQVIGGIEKLVEK
jgi:heptosyltransferase-2